MKNRYDILSAKTKKQANVLPEGKLFCSHSATPCQYCYYAYCHDWRHLLTKKKCPTHAGNLVHYYGDSVIYCLVGKEIFRK